VGVDLADCQKGDHSAGRIGATHREGIDWPGRCLARSVLRQDYRLWRPIVATILLAAISACSSSPPHHAGAPPVTAAQSSEYAPPGPPDDPWGPYLHEASQRFDFPEHWIREVMRQESGGQQYRNGALTTSGSGAIGLMQVMPETYAELRERYGLGPDPYYPRDNILAGTAYLRELYRKFGSPAFLAAYNAGGGRVTDHLATGRPLPAQTVAYVAAIGPRIGAGSTVPGGTNPNYADNSSTLSDALNRQALAAATGKSPTPAAPPPEPPPKILLASAAPAVIAAPLGGGWGVQVGAFSNPSLAQAAAENVRARAHGQLDATRTVVPTTTRPDGVTLYRARLFGLTADAASGVCNNLARDQVSCIVVAEDRA
jgi:D-alanyl-D-alanine carboxypeptidase